MINLAKAAIESDEIIGFLKKEMRLREVCQKILTQKVISRAAQERGIKVTQEEIQAEGDRFRQQNRLQKASETQAWLGEQMVTPEDWEESIRDRLLAQKLAQALFAKEVEKFFAQNSLNFEQIALYQIIVASEGVAQEVFYQLSEQEISFYEAAHLYDLDENRRYRCGYEGKIYRWSLDPVLAAAAFSGKVLEAIGPIKTDRGYHLLMVEELIRPALTPEIFREILDKMFKEWLAGELNFMLHSQAS